MARSYLPAPLTPQEPPPARDPLAAPTEYVNPWPEKAAPPAAAKRRWVKPTVWTLLMVALVLVALKLLVWI
ncbi:MAG: hypothetical protein QOJ26_1039 [Thermoplasmata archaeon]|jgi:hypothetical protein|nr:hypothetical protein [Thermoplasmata archaeon]MEA3166170.1 hypothetical protein [Thermoplasmata archaeon]